MKQNARTAFDALKRIGAPVIDHGNPSDQWDAHFILGAELRTAVDVYFADYYDQDIREYVNSDGKIINACGIRQDVIEILDKSGLYAEWIDPGTVGIYDA